MKAFWWNCDTSQCWQQIGGSGVPLYRPYVRRGLRRKMHYIKKFIQTFQLCFVGHAIAPDRRGVQGPLTRRATVTNTAYNSYRCGMRWLLTRRATDTNAACNGYRHGLRWLSMRRATNTACNDHRCGTRQRTMQHTMTIDAPCNGYRHSVLWPPMRQPPRMMKAVASRQGRQGRQSLGAPEGKGPPSRVVIFCVHGN